MIYKNQRKKFSLRRYIALLLLSAMVLAGTMEAQAAGRVEVEREGQLSLEYSYDGKALSGAVFSLYRVADITESGEYVLSGSFSEYHVNLKELDSTGWKTAANTLSVYVSSDKIEPFKTGRADSEGRVDFGTLATGLYLLQAEDLKIGSATYRSDPFFVSLPALEENDEWNYTVEVRPKTTADTPSSPDGGNPSGGNPSGEKQKLTVIKVWNDDGYREMRPRNIEVALLKDGEVDRKATLSSSNYWRHTWSGLSDEYTWEVVERNVPDGYDVSYTEEETVYTITNSVLEEILDGDVPEGSMLTNIEEEPVPLGKLPQTGLLWWPVPFLAIAGMLLFGFGYRDYFSRKRNENEN